MIYNSYHRRLRTIQRWLPTLTLGLILSLGIWRVTTTAPPLHAQAALPTAFTCSTVTEIPTSECEALVALYTSTNGPGWTNQSGWLTTTTPCSWYGITCQANQVKRLELSNNGLTGVIPPVLANLTALQKLWLSYNRLSGSIPPELGNLANLQLLHLVGNQLTGSIPPQLGNLTQLYQLSLDANALSGPISAELGNLTRLRELRLTYNQLSGTIPTTLGNLANLQGLMLAQNRLEGTIPAELGNLTNLQLADFTGNALRGAIPPQLVNWGAMDHLKFDYNALTATDGALLAWLADEAPGWDATQTVPPKNVILWHSYRYAPNLMWSPILYTADSGYYEISFALDAAGPFVVRGQTQDKFTTVYSSYPPMGGPPVDYARVRTYTPAHARNQNELWSDYSNIATTYRTFNCANVKEIPLNECAALTMLFYSTGGANTYVGGWSNHSWLTDNTPCDWLGLSCENGHVVQLSLTHTNLRNNIPSELDALTQLRILDLSGNLLQGAIPASLGNLTQLVTLRLHSNDLSGTLPSTLGNLTNLQELLLVHNALSGAIPQELGNLVNLEHLVLVANQLSGPIPSTLGNLHNLKELGLSVNQLTENIPSTLSNLTNLTTLTLNHNQLTGPIPAGFGNLVNLEVLDLEWNHLSGQIPPQFGNLAQLYYLTLAENQLRGEIPSALTQLSKLTTLRLNYNMFTAPDPTVSSWLDHLTPGWLATQTIPPTNLTLQPFNNGQITVAWTPILYTGDVGYYEISYATAATGPFMTHGVTANKSSQGYTLTELIPAPTYFVRLRTYTLRNGYNINELWSDYSPAVSTGGGATNLLVNGNFEADTAPWLFTTNGVGTLTTASPAYEGNAAAQIAITQKGTNTQLYQTGFPLEPKTRYRLTLAARSSRGQDLALYLQQAASPNANYGLRNFRLNLTRDWKQFTVEFVTKGFKQPTTDTQLRVWLQPYMATGDRYWLDAISLTKVNASAAAAQTEQGGSGTITGTVQLPPALTGPVTLTLVDLENEGSLFTQTVTAAADGTFAFSAVPAGIYELRATGPAGTLPPEPYQLLVDATPAESLDFVFEVATDTLYLPLINR